MKNRIGLNKRCQCVTFLFILITLSAGVSAQETVNEAKSYNESFTLFANKSRLVSLFMEFQNRLQSSTFQPVQSFDAANKRVVLLPANIHFLYIQNLLFPETLESFMTQDKDSHIYVIYDSNRGEALRWVHSLGPLATNEVGTKIQIYQETNGTMTFIDSATKWAGKGEKTVLEVVTNSIDFPTSITSREEELRPIILAVLAYSDGHDIQQTAPLDNRALALYHTLVSSQEYYDAKQTEKHRAVKSLGLIGTPLAGELLIDEYNRLYDLDKGSNIDLLKGILISLSYCKGPKVGEFLIEKLYIPKTSIPSLARVIGSDCNLKIADPVFGTDHEFYCCDALRIAAAHALGGLGDKKALPHLEKFIENEWAASAAERLGYIPDSRDLMIRFYFGLCALGYGDSGGYTVNQRDQGYYENCRNQVINAGEESVPILLDIAMNNPGDNSGQENLILAIQMLGNIASPKAVTFLLGALEHRNPNVARKAALALGKIGDKNAVQPVMKLLEDKMSNPYHSEDFVMIDYITALGLLGDKTAVGLVMEFLDNKNDNVQKTAEESLSKITGENLGRDKTKWKKWMDEQAK